MNKNQIKRYNLIKQYCDKKNNFSSDLHTVGKIKKPMIDKQKDLLADDRCFIVSMWNIFSYILEKIDFKRLISYPEIFSTDLRFVGLTINKDLKKLGYNDDVFQVTLTDILSTIKREINKKNGCVLSVSYGKLNVGHSVAIYGYNDKSILFFENGYDECLILWVADYYCDQVIKGKIENKELLVYLKEHNFDKEMLPMESLGERANFARKYVCTKKSNYVSVISIKYLFNAFDLYCVVYLNDMYDKTDFISTKEHLKAFSSFSYKKKNDFCQYINRVNLIQENFKTISN